MFLLLFLPMASLTKRLTSVFWVACFTDRNGRRLKRSTGSADRKQALKIAEQFEDAARRKRTAMQARRVIAQLHAEITGEGMPVQTLREFLDSWLAVKQAETASATISFYRSSARKFLVFLGERGDVDIAEIEKKDILAFRAHEAKSLAPKSVNHSVKFLRMVFKAARRDGLTADNPAEFVETVRNRNATERRPFTLDELRAVLAVAGEEWRSMILFALYTGQRLSDIACLTWGSVDVEKGEIRLVTRKTGKRLVIPMAEPLARVVAALPSSDDPSGPLHPRAHAIVNAQGKSGHLSNQFADLLSDAGLRIKTPHRATAGNGRGAGRTTGGLSFHCLRHTAVTLLKEAGVPDAVVMELVGHDSVAMSAHYTHVGREALQKAAGTLPDLA